MQSLGRVLSSRHFWPLFGTQFFGAFNDNAFKQALILLLTFQTATYSDLPVGLLTNLCAGLFILPFFLFSGIAGQWADRFEKAQLTRQVKVLEICLMSLAFIGFYLQSLPLLLLTLFGMGSQSALFGPIKYAWLPERLAPNALMPANALVETATSLAILLGSLFGGVLVTVFDADVRMLGGSLIAIALVGWSFSRRMPIGVAIKPDQPTDYHLVRNTKACLGALRRNAFRWRLSLGISWFWLFGALWLTQLPEFTAVYLGGDAGVATALLVLFSVGIGIGSLACHTLVKVLAPGRVVMIGGLLMATLSLLNPSQSHAGELLNLSQWLNTPGVWRHIAQLTAVGVSAGMYIVPLYVLIQVDAAENERAQVIAGINVLNALFMVSSALAAMIVLGVLGLSLYSLMTSLGLLTLITTWLWRFERAPEK
jgi:hypothetical protein